MDRHATGELSRSRVTPADCAGVRRFLARFRGQELEVALEATTGWRFVVEELRRVMKALEERRFRADPDAVLDYLAPGGAEIVPLEIDPRDPRRLLARHCSCQRACR